MEDKSILRTIKKMLGDVEGNEGCFDTDIIVLINSAFSRLNTAGIGPVNTFYITGNDETWDDFTLKESPDGLIQEFVFLRVKQMFDPPESSFLLTAYKEREDEILWLLNATWDEGY